MNRRDFLKASAIGAAALAAPVSLLEAAPVDRLTAESLVSMFDCLAGMSPGMGPYLMFVHPEVHRKLVEINARDKWQRAYRDYRKNFTGILSPREILAQYGRKEGLMRGELGQMDGIRIIKTELPR